MSERPDGRNRTVVGFLSSDYLLQLGMKTVVEAKPWIRLIVLRATRVQLTETHIIVIDTDVSNDVSGLIRQMKKASPPIRIILLTTLHNTKCASLRLISWL